MMLKCYLCGNDIGASDVLYQIVKGRSEGETYPADVIDERNLCSECADKIRIRTHLDL
jgi:hypothetical protein